ncbi:leukocyte-associated immunoglobulin-like receptor 1 isoform X3 [Ailuropoda melanoleuca]|uniref:leukocyte-associated immunoglobulin-like receptor 1 isoform X3 n=1 Tax=Ailuropoda melanoleuca TaxID=9646 RepID=UPI001494DB5B|nr:leukocyte-associated immunoglobulin-like receptor 1 isoform X3 [Ailuropoda melanoleuca]
MSPHVTPFLALALCLGQVLHAQNGVLPKPSIRAEPASVIPRGQTVTIVCQGPAGVDTFRLEKEGKVLYPDVKSLHGTEAQAAFPVPTSEDTAGLYHCLYYNGADWSQRSEPLQLVVTEDPQTPWDDSNSSGLSTEHVSILTGVSVALLLCVFLVLIVLCCQRRKKHRPPGSQDLATVDRLPEKDGEMHTPTPTAGGPPDVTYAQLDHRILTQRTAQAASLQPTEPTAEFSTYAALATR